MVDMTSMEWVFPPAQSADEHGIVGIGADLRPSTLLAAYSQGIFPMPIESEGPIVWWSPDPRAIIPVDELHISRSLRKSMKRFSFTFDVDFATVVDRCGDPERPHGWIDGQMRKAYVRLHELGWAHSIEARNSDGDLVGGVYGVGIGTFFAGESMFHTETDAGKAALVALVGRLREKGLTLFDVQWLTPHLASMGAIELPRSEYLRVLSIAVSEGRTDPGRLGRLPV